MQKTSFYLTGLLALFISACSGKEIDTSVTGLHYAGSADILNEGRFNMTVLKAGKYTCFAGGYIERPAPLPDTFSSSIDVYDELANVWNSYTRRHKIDYFGVAATAGKLITAGGRVNAIAITNEVEIIDLHTGVSSFSTLSEARALPGAVAAGNKVIIAGGRTANSVSAVVDIYDVSSSAWTTAALSEARYNPSAGAAANKIVFAGGQLAMNGVASDAVDIYDIQTGQWTSHRLAQARYNMGVVSAGNKIFFAGGYSNDPVFVHSDYIDIYDAQTNQWTFIKLEQHISPVSICGNGNKVFFASGKPPFLPQAQYLQVYTISDGSFETWLLPMIRSGFAMSSIGDKLLIAGGTSADIYRKDVMVFDTASASFDISTYRLPHEFAGGVAATAGNRILVAGGLVQAADPATGLHVPVNYKTVSSFLWNQ